MNTRRGFFRRVAAVVAAVAIAPEIAFRTRLALPKADLKLDTEYCCLIRKPDCEEILYSETWTFKTEGEAYVIENFSCDA